MDTAQENWDEELEGSGSGTNEPVQPQMGGEEQESDAKPTPEANPEAESIPSKSENNQDEGGRAKRAQRTRRMKLPGGTQPAANQGASQAATSQSTQGKPSINQTQEKTTNQNPVNASSPSATPIQIPPQVHVAFQNGDESDDDLAGGKEPSRIMGGLCCVAGGTVNAIHGLWYLVRGLIQAVANVLLTPALLGSVLYVTLVYAALTLLVDRTDLSHLNGFEAALRYVLAIVIWAVLPLSASFLATYFNANARHQQFMYESIIDAMIFVANSCVMTVHATSECLVWLGPIYVISALFRFLYWASLFRLSPKWQLVFRMPSVLNTIVLTTFNLGLTFQPYAGIHGRNAPTESDLGMDVTSVQDVAPRGEATPSGQEPSGLFYNTNVCDLVEKIFCRTYNNHVIE